MKERIAIVNGVRTPLCKSGGKFKNLEADDLAAIAAKELLARTDIAADQIDEVIFGNVAQPIHSANVARVIALKAGIPEGVTAQTVHRNCASGMQAITTGAELILAGRADIILAGGTESMSNIPLIYGRKMTDMFMHLSKAKTAIAKLKVLTGFRLSHLKPIIGIHEGLRDPVCGLSMGETAEILAREFHVTREEQDTYALMSHERAVAATESGALADEIVPVPIPPDYRKVQAIDDGPRHDQSMHALQKLRPYFDKYAGSVTIGNACPVTDGAAVVLLASESKAKELNLKPLGYLRNYEYAALNGRRMGLGPAYATAKLLDRTGLTMEQFELVELNEAFAAQVIANERAFSSKEFAQKYLNRDKAVGELRRNLLNVNGGAIALGHPVGATGTRLVLTLLKEMNRRNAELGLATLCVGGGQGAALALEVA